MVAVFPAREAGGRCTSLDDIAEEVVQRHFRHVLFLGIKRPRLLTRFKECGEFDSASG